MISEWSALAAETGEKRKNRSWRLAPVHTGEEEFNFLDLNLFLSANIFRMRRCLPGVQASDAIRCHTY